MLKYSFLLLLAATATTTTLAQSDNVCTVCFTGDDIRFPDEEACTSLAPRTNGLFNTDNDCLTLQLEAYQKGCCNNPPFEFCDYCPDGTDYNPDMIVPTGQYVGGLTCFDYKYQNQAHIGLFSDGVCEDTFLQRAGFYCGCPNTQQSCWLCPDGNPPNKPGKGDSWVTSTDCRGIEFMFSLFDELECKNFPMDAGADLAIFCGCGGLNQTEIEEQQELFQCELCRNGGFVVNPDMTYTDDEDAFQKTCQQADDFAKDVIKTPSGCNNPNFFEKARNACCSNGSGAASLSLWGSKFAILVMAVAAALV